MNRVIPMKNYIILGVVILLTFLLMYYFHMWYDVYMEDKLNKAIMDKYMEVINYNELDNYLVENTNTILYVSILEDIDVRNFEKKFKNMYRKKKISRDILYMDVAEDVGLINSIMNKYSSGLNSGVPTLIVFEDGKIKSFYDIKENNYNVDGVIEFIDGIKFFEEDEVDG